MKSDNFVCLHEALKHCKRTFEKCNPKCRAFGDCGECVNYHIPHSQEPCHNCKNLKVRRDRMYKIMQKITDWLLGGQLDKLASLCRG